MAFTTRLIEAGVDPSVGSVGDALDNALAETTVGRSRTPRRQGSDEVAEAFVRAPVIGHPDGYVSSIHLADAASGVVAALDAPGGTYNVVDDEPLTKRDFATALADGVGVRP